MIKQRLLCLFYLFSLFLHDLCLEDVPKSARDADGRISAADDTNHQRKGELFDRADAVNVKRCNHDEGRQGSEDTSRQGLVDAFVYNLCKILILTHVA